MIPLAAAEGQILLPSLALSLAMGLRHGLAPDHLAAIDGLTMNAVAARPRLAPWMGTLFACGHAAAVLAIVTAAASTSAWVAPYHSVVHWIELMPPIFLLLIAALNARILITPQVRDARTNRLAGLLRMRLGTGAWSAVGVGVLFAVGFESAVQAIAWGYAAAAMTSLGPALLVAAAFTGGMLVTDSIDGWLTARISRTGNPHRMAQFRRRIGWPVVALCIVSALTMLAQRTCSTCGIDEEVGFVIGGTMLAATAAMYGLSALMAWHDTD